ncbi:MAG: DUF4114 domain-containing protein, partial [Bacteroidota bacterium]
MKKVILFLFQFAFCFFIQAQYKYLGSYNSSGVPDYLVGTDEVSQKLLDDIHASIPERRPVPSYNPHLISAGYDTDIRLLDSAEVFVTFAGEGAGYKNVLGFYTYDLDHPYQSAPPANEVTIIFPNVSAVGSGGGLEVGNKVKLGNFPGNTGIGWVLIANGWRGRVTNGNWVLYSNPDFNPEANPDLRYHNVLIQDAESELVVLGFEDIRRDYGSDNDFNDALFYVSANPFEAIATNNVSDIVDSEEGASSGNDGGLESDGSLAAAISKRNFKRASEGTGFNLKGHQEGIQSYKRNRATGAGLHRYFPDSGLYEMEEVTVSTPTDLIELTNATDVFATDHYQQDRRVAASLLISTKEGAYNHSKNICDRLNGKSIEEAQVITFKGIDVIYAKIEEKASGATEYAAWFSAKNNEDHYETYSLWSVDDYPNGDYLNFQAWGSSPAHVFHILGYAVDQVAQEKPVVPNAEIAQLP